MEMSCTKAQSETQARLFAAERLQPGYDAGTTGTYFFDGGSGHGKDYGLPGAMNMCIPIMVMLDGGLCQRIGYAKISPEGKFSLPRVVREILAAGLG